MSEKDEPPKSSPLSQEDKTIDMDFIKSFLSKTEDKESKNRNDSTNQGTAEDQQNTNKTDASDSEKSDIDQSNNENNTTTKKKKRNKSKKIKKKGKPSAQLIKEFETINKVKNENEIKRENEVNAKSPPATPSPRKVRGRPPSAPKRRDMDLESIELVQRRNQISLDYSSKPLPAPRKSSFKNKNVPVVQLRHSGGSNVKSTRFNVQSRDVNNGTNYDEFEYHVPQDHTKGSSRVVQNKENMDMSKQRWHLQHKAAKSQIAHESKMQHHDYHSKKLQDKYGELQDLLEQEVFDKKGTKSKTENPEVFNYAKSMMKKYGVTVVDSSLPNKTASPFPSYNVNSAATFTNSNSVLRHSEGYTHHKSSTLMKGKRKSPRNQLATSERYTQRYDEYDGGSQRQTRKKTRNSSSRSRSRSDSRSRSRSSSWSTGRSSSNSSDERISEEKAKTTVLCTKLPPKVQHHHLEKCFESMGKITNVDIIVKDGQPHSKAYVEFEHISSVSKALALNGQHIPLLKQTITVFPLRDVYTKQFEKRQFKRHHGSKRHDKKTDTFHIDISRDLDSKHVKFAKEGESDESSSLDQGSEDIINVEREIALETLSDKQGQTRKSRKKSGRHKSRSPESSISSSRGSQRHYWSTDTVTSDTDSSPSRSPNRLTDCNLRNSDNVDIQKWLRRKNREIRRRKRGEQKKKQQQVKEETDKIKDKCDRDEQSKKKVHEWMKSKKKEARLLRRKQRKSNSTFGVSKTTNSDFKFGGKVTVEEKVLETNEDRDEMVADGKEKEEDSSCQGKSMAELLTPKGRALSKKKFYPGQKVTTSSKTVEVNMAGVDHDHCTCGYVEVQKLKEEELKQTRVAARMRALQAQRARQAEKAKRAILRPNSATVTFSSTPQGPQKSDSLPDISKSKDGRPNSAKNKGEKKELSNEEKERQQKLSYDKWIKKKKEEDKKKREEEKRKKEELASSMDEETKEVVRNVARNRIDNIMKGKKKIDTGVKRIDDTANQSIEERIESKKKSQNQQNSAKNKSTDGDESTNEDKEANSSVFLTQGDSPRVNDRTANSASNNAPRYIFKKSDKGPLNDDKKSKRPSSARPASAKGKGNAGTKVRPSSAKASMSIEQKGNRADKVKSDHKNPFSLPHPPPPKNHSPSSPRPKVKKSPAYKNVKYQQRSWESFADNVWDQVNEQVNEECGDTVRPEPMGADNPDEAVINTDDTSERSKPVPAARTSKSRQERDVHTPPGALDDNSYQKENDEPISAQKDNANHMDETDYSIPDPPLYNEKVRDRNLISDPPKHNEKLSDENLIPEPPKYDEKLRDGTQDNMDEAPEKNIWDEIKDETNKVVDRNEQKVQGYMELNEQERQELRLNLDNEEMANEETVTVIPDRMMYIPPTREKKYVGSSKTKSEKSVRFKEEVETQEFVQNDFMEATYENNDDYTEDSGQQQESGFGASNELVGLEIPPGIDEKADDYDENGIPEEINKTQDEEDNIKDEENDLPPGYNPDDESGDW